MALRLLTDKEIEEVYNEFDHDNEGRISFQKLKDALSEVHKELAPNPNRHHLTHPERSNTETKEHNTVPEKPTTVTKTHEEQHNDLDDFLCQLLPGCTDSISKEDFLTQVRSWNVPSQDQTGSDDDIDQAKEYERKLPLRRRWIAWWSVKGPEVVFLTFVGALTLGFSLWQGLLEATNPKAREAFGGGVIVAKFCAGALYPIFFFLILSMSRWFATVCRKSYQLSRFINWDLSQSFHVKMACTALVLSLIHAIAHLCGTFRFGSSANRQESIQRYFGASYIRRSYPDWLASRPGWTGITALACFIIVGLSSNPWFRKKHYELFQLSHMLMYPMFVMLGIHGTARLLRMAMFGYWLLLPVFCVVLERGRRFCLIFLGHHSARLEALDDGTVVITAKKPEGCEWQARAGQYILLQVPVISRYQWHPFTISACIGSRLQVHIKANGDWTEKLHKLAMSAKDGQDDDFVMIKVGVDGPFGAPAQRFYSFDKSIVIGSGIGITPFAACLTDLEEKSKAQGDPWKLTPIRSFGPRRKRTIDINRNAPLHRTQSEASSERTAVEGSDAADTPPSPISLPINPNLQSGTFGVRRCEFHWSVRAAHDLQWFSDLLNRASVLAEHNHNLTLNIRAHITAKRKKLSTHVFTYLLDSYRTKDFPYSALTGLRIKSEFGRPNYEAILKSFYNDMKEQGWNGRVGVFHCGPPAVGKMLADLCARINARAATESPGMRFMFHNEVYG